MNRLPFLGHEKWEKNHWTVRAVRNCLCTEVAPDARRQTSLTLISPSARTAELGVERIRSSQYQQLGSRRRRMLPSGQVNSIRGIHTNHSQSSQA